MYKSLPYLLLNWHGNVWIHVSLDLEVTGFAIGKGD